MNVLDVEKCYPIALAGGVYLFGLGIIVSCLAAAISEPKGAIIKIALARIVALLLWGFAVICGGVFLYQGIFMGKEAIFWKASIYFSFFAMMPLWMVVRMNPSGKERRGA